MEETLERQVRYDVPPPLFNHRGTRGKMEGMADGMKPGGSVSGLTQKERAALMKTLRKRDLPCTSKKEGHTFTVWRLEEKGKNQWA